jgi:hypothetical protein
MLKLCIGCFGISVNVLVNIVIQMVQSVVVGYLVKKNKKICEQNMFMYVCFIFGKKLTQHGTQFLLDRTYSYQQYP